jgi:dGTPase
MMTIRERTEQIEEEILSPFAARAKDSKGRLREEQPDPVRTAYQIDRDRVLHSKAFRRLKHKTQVFLDPEEDHYRTRLTHSLEVAQVSRTVARALRLNEDLTEAIALAHDLGHPPFGHEGEHALDTVLKEYLPDAHFRHYEQSLRVVDVLEKHGAGLNLTLETRSGIVGHSKGRADLSASDAEKSSTTMPLEASVVRICDRIAYLNHDIDDAVRAGLLHLSELPQNSIDILGPTAGDRMTTLVQNVIDSSLDKPVVSLEEPYLGAVNVLKDYMYDNIYLKKNIAKAELAKGSNLVKMLFRLYMEQPELIPDARVTKEMDVKTRAYEILDYVSGMTDRYAMDQFIRHYFPRGWSRAMLV